MKSIILSLVIVLQSMILAAQAPTYVYVETQVQGSDTLRTFYVEDNYCQKLIEQFTADFGAPNGAGSGSLKWSSVEINGLGNNLTIEASDGARIFDGANWSFSTFQNAADMEAKLSADPARARRMYITIKKGNKNRVSSADAENAFVAFAEQIMLGS
ncbi:MAG: hypothetical protein R2813_04400 [Flavobacteriales bacterium]